MNTQQHLAEELRNQSVRVGKLKKTLDRLTRAAANRENTMGDPMRLIEVKAELRAAVNEARAALAPN